MPEVKNGIIILERQFLEMTEIMQKKDWKFYKFGLGGPYKDKLPELKFLAEKWDNVLHKEFSKKYKNNPIFLIPSKAKKEYVGFNTLVVLCLQNDNVNEEITRFGTRLRKMKEIISV